MLGLSPWAGRNAKGQRELFQDIGKSVRQQLAGEPAIKIFRVEAGHGVGKTYGGAMLVNWFFDAFPPSGVASSVVLTTAPTATQVEDLLWADVKTMRPGSLPGRVLPGTPRMVKASNWWAVGRTTTDAGGKGTARSQGKHPEFGLFLLDEAEGVPEFFFNAVWAMMTGGRVIIVLLFANPQTRTSRFHKIGREPGVSNYRLSVLDFPNVLDGRETIVGGTRREWVIGCIQKWCDVVPEMNEDSHTFTVPFDVPPPEQGEGTHGPAGTVFEPNTEFLFRVMGVAPANMAADTFVPVGRFEAAVKRGKVRDEGLFPNAARLGIDCAGYGTDMGTLYVRLGKRVWRAAQMSKRDSNQDPFDYWQKTRQAALPLAKQGVTSLHIRIDAGGGFGNGVYDRLKRDAELQAAFPDFQLHMVHFGGSPHDPEAYSDMGTNLYAEAAEAIKGLGIVNPPETLEGDLCERRYKWVSRAEIAVKKLQSKDEFRRELQKQGHARSPDDGDGFVLSVAPDFMFTAAAWEII